MTKIDIVHKNYLTHEIWGETHLREIFYGTSVFQQSSMNCIGSHVGGHAFALQHDTQATWRPKQLFACIMFDSYVQMCFKCYHVILSTISVKLKCKISVQEEVIHSFKNQILVTWPAIYEHPHIFKKMVQVWKTKALFFSLRYDPLIVFWRQNHITFIKMMSHDFYGNGLFSIFEDLGGWQPWMRWIHIAPIKGFSNLFTDTYMQSRERKDREILMQEETNFYTPRKIITNFTNCYCPRPPGKMQCYKSVIPWLCARYSLAMSRGSVGHGFNWLVHLTFGHRDTRKTSVFANCLTMYCKPFKNVMYVCIIYVT